LWTKAYGAASRRSRRIAIGARAEETVGRQNRARTRFLVREPRRGMPLLHRRSGDAVSCKSCALDRPVKPATHAPAGLYSSQTDSAHLPSPDAPLPRRVLFRKLALSRRPVGGIFLGGDESPGPVRRPFPQR